MIEENENTSAGADFNEYFKDQLISYLRHWKWFLLSAIIFIILAFIQLNFTRAEYRGATTVLLQSDDDTDDSKLSVFQDLGFVSNSRDRIDDEMEILQSRNLIDEVIRSLNLNIQFYTNKNKISNFFDNTFSTSTNFFEKERYLDPPISINFFVSDSAIQKMNTELLISIISPTAYTYTDEFGTFKGAFGEKVKSKVLGDLIITPNFTGNAMVGEIVLVQFVPVRALVGAYLNRLAIEARSDFSNIVDIRFSGSDRKKVEDFLNQLIIKYNDRSVREKELLSASTSDFVNKRLEIIETELTDIDLSAEKFKTRYRLSDVASEAGLNLQGAQEVERQIVQANAELEKIKYLQDYVSTKSDNELIPVNLDIADNNVSTSFQQYNDLMMQKKRLLENSTEKNPIVVNINDQLKTLKNNINQGLGSLQSSQQISIDALNKQDARINSRLYSAPKQERQYKTITRQQQIKEALFLYLLQKREETAITLGVAEPNAKIIDKPESSAGIISPKKKIVYMAALLIGLLIPFVILYILDFLDTKIKSKEEVQKLLPIPILGDIPKYEGTKNFLIAKNDHSSVAEAFRILRTNLGFLLTDTTTKGKTIFVTSTIAGEGKSFVSTNLATSLAYASKKTLLIGMDIRAPKIKPYLGIKGNKGVTNFIIDKNLTVEDVIINVPKVEGNLDLISSGDIPPNPAELLMNSRVKELFDSVREKYDYIIVDTAASSIITDTMLIRNHADAFVYVIRTNHLDKKQLSYLKSVYKENRYPNLAILVNGVDQKKGYGYGYGYGPESDQAKKKAWWKLGTS